MAQLSLFNNTKKIKKKNQDTLFIKINNKTIMAQLSLFSNTNKKNTMAVKKTKAVTAAKSRVKKASTALRSAKKKVTAAKKTYVKLVQTGSSSKKADAKRKALKPGKRVSKAGAKNQYGTSEGGKTYYEYRANRTDLKPRSKGRSL